MARSGCCESRSLWGQSRTSSAPGLIPGSTLRFTAAVGEGKQEEPPRFCSACVSVSLHCRSGISFTNHVAVNSHLLIPARGVSALLYVHRRPPVRSSSPSSPPAVPEDAFLATLRSDVSLTCAGCAGWVSWSRRSSHEATRPLKVMESGHLVLHSVAYEDEDNYMCYKNGAPVCSVELIVKDGRHKDTSLSCYHRHPTHNITCEWRPTEQLHPSSTVTLIKVRMLEEPTFYPCTYNRSSAAFTCSALYREGDSSRHVFYLCVSGRTDSELSANLEAKVEDLLHVGPPLDVRVTPVEHRPRKLRVSWSRPEFWENPFYGLVFQVLYRVENSPHQSNGTTTEMSFIIDDALMGRRHLIQVRAREEYQRNWGSWSEEAAGVPWSDGATTTLVPVQYSPPTPPEQEDPKDQHTPDPPPPVTRISWIAPCVSFGLVSLFFLGLWIRFQEMKFLKLQWGVLRSLFHPSLTQLPATESPLMSSPSSVVVTVPPLLDGE